MRKKISELEVGDVVLNHGMRILIDGPVRVYSSSYNPDLRIYRWPGLVLNADAICDKDGSEYDAYIACHLRGIWFEDRMGPKRKDEWSITSNDLAWWFTGEPWQEHGPMHEGGDDSGGDIQCGTAYERRFLHTKLPGRVFELTAYPIMGDGTDERHPEGVIRIQQQICTTICRDVDDIGNTEEWSEYSYPELPERFDIDFTSMELAQEAARIYVETFDPEHINWDGKPEWKI